MANKEGKCPVCNLEGNGEVQYSPWKDMDSYFYECERCGPFILSRTAFHQMRREQGWPDLSAWIRGKKENGEETPEIDSTTLKTLENSYFRPSPTEKPDLLISYLGKKAKNPSSSFPIVPRLDYPVIGGENEDEIDYYIDYLSNLGLIKTDLEGEVGSLAVSVQLTPEGWKRFSEVNVAKKESLQAFVAMDFSEELFPIWQNYIVKAIQNCGYNPYRVDQDTHNEMIDFKIMHEISKSKFMVADVTNQKNGVYFEAGYAAGQGIPVIWVVRKDDLKNVHFDTRQYNHILWETGEDLSEQLETHIKVLIGSTLKTQGVT